MKNRIQTPIVWLALTLLVLVNGYSKIQPPEFVASDFDIESVDRVTVLKMVDHRVGVEAEPRLDKWVKKIVEISFKKARIEVSIETAPEWVEAVSRDGLEDEDSEMIAKLGPSGSRWVLVLELHDATSSLSLGSSGAAEMTGYLFDKERRAVVWRNKELAEARQGGLMGVAMKGAMKITAIQMAAGAVLQSLPKKEKVKKRKK